MNPTIPIVLQESYNITSRVKHFVFKASCEPAFSYLPGQFITVHFENDAKLLRRSYSIANAPGNDNIIEFAAGFIKDGPGTNLLFNLKAGESININGPFGRLIKKDDPFTRHIFIATSTGITPYRAMLEQLDSILKTDHNLKIVILQGVQLREHILYGTEFQKFAAKFPGQVIFEAWLSRAAANKLLQGEKCGYVQHAFPKLNLNSAQDKVYLCGNPAMIDDAFNYLKEKNFPTTNVIREKYISR